MGGEAVPIRGEMAAVARTMQVVNTMEEENEGHRDLTILTDSLTTIQIIERWKRGDFGPDELGEKHWDILLDMLRALRGRGGGTTIAWVRSHAGDVGNELADARAGAGIGSDTTRWDRDTHPIALYSLETGDVVSPHGWTKAAARTAGEWYGRHARDRLAKEGAAYSTTSLVRSDRGREHLGYSMTEGWQHGLTDFDIRTMMQARANCYPTEVHLAKFKKGTGTGTCKLCRRHKETYGHVQAGCRELREAHRTAHNIMAEAILGEIKKAADHLDIKTECTLGDWHPECPADMGAFRPDAFIVDETKMQVVVWEFTRGMADTDEAFQQREARKRHAYHGVCLYLRNKLQDYEVSQQTVVMGILTSTKQKEFDRQLEALGLGEKEREQVGRTTAIAAVRANGYVLSQRLDKLTLGRQP